MLTLRQHNAAFNFQRQMDNSTALTYSRALRSDWEAIKEFELYAREHPNQWGALNFLWEALTPKHLDNLARRLGGWNALEATLCNGQ